MSLVLGIFSFESVFVLFLFAGQYKADPRFDWIPYDATVFFGLISLLQALFIVVNPKSKLNSVGLPVLAAGIVFALYVVASLAWSEGVRYANYKAAYIALICTWCLCAGAVIISASPERLVRFLKVLVLFTGWIAIECLLFYFDHLRFGRVTQVYAMAGEGAYIGLGRAISSGGLVCGILWLFGRPQRWDLWQMRTTTLFVLLFFVASAAITGARGPIAAAVLAIIAVCFVFARGTAEVPVTKKISRIGAMLLVCYLFAHIYQMLLGDLPLAVQRFLAFSSDSQYFDSSGQSYSRLELFAEAFHAWLERPLLGHGIGSFPTIWANLDERLFPHNLILEVLCELGLVGLGLFLAIPGIAWGLKASARRRTDVRLTAAVIALAAYTVGNAMTSGDLPDNRIVFFALGLLAFRNPESQRPVGLRPRRQPTLRNRSRFTRTRVPTGSGRRDPPGQSLAQPGGDRALS